METAARERIDGGAGRGSVVPQVLPLFTARTRAWRITAWSIVVVPLLFAVVGLVVPKAPPRPQKRSLHETRARELSAVAP